MIPLRDSIPSRSIPIVTYFLIAVNIAVFIMQMSFDSAAELERFIFNHAIIPVVFLQDPYLHFSTLISSQFMHGGLMHILGNMWFLYLFGDNVEDNIGHWKFLAFYILAGIAAALAQVYIHPNSQIPMVGASGAIAGVLGAYFIFYPHSRVMTLVPLGFYSRVIEIPAFFFLGLWFLMQTFSGTSALYVARASGQDAGGVAWWAHAGGFVFGFAIGIIKRIL